MWLLGSLWLLVTLHLGTFQHFHFNDQATCDRVGASMQLLVDEDEGKLRWMCVRIREEIG